MRLFYTNNALFKKALLLLVTVLILTTALSAQPFAYVANVTGFTVSVVNTANNSIVTSIPVPGASGLAVTPDGTMVYVCAQNSNSVYAISTANNSIVAKIAVGTTPVQLAISPNGAYVFVVNQASNNISVIGTSSNSVVSTIGVGSRPTAVAFTPDGGHAFVTNLWSSTVSVIDAAARSVSSTFKSASGPSAVAVSPNSRTAYIANEYTSDITVYDIASASTVGTIGGMSFPTSLAFTPDGNKLFVTNANSSSVSIINPSSNTVVTTTPVGNYPSWVAISADGARAYVTNEYNFSMSVLDTAKNAVMGTITGVGIYPFAVAMVPPQPNVSSPPPPPPSNPTIACSYAISPGNATYGFPGGTGSVAITSNCQWSAISNVPWITISGGQSGSGNGTLTYVVAPNNGSATQNGTMTIAGQTFNVTELGLSCSYSISSAAATIGSGAGNGTLTVTTASGCSWTASSDSSWVSISSGASGNGNGAVSFLAAPNDTTGTRTAHLTIAGLTYTLNQAGVGFSGIRMNCGGPAVTDGAGVNWASDNQGNHSETITPIANTNVQPLYQKDSWSTGTLQYQFNVPNGQFTVKLHFAEFYLTQKGQRVFDIVINGTTVFGGYDILARTAVNTAIDEIFPVTVNNGQVTIQLIPVTGPAKLNALEIY